MKGLLHSKKFRKNLYKWLFMYVGCIALLTTVVTYSKYMSTFQSSDSARVAKFNVEVKKNNICNNENTEYCNKEVTRLTSYIDYYFTIDTTDLEVTTDLALTLYVDENFEIKDNKIFEIDKDEKTKEILLNPINDNHQGEYIIKNLSENKLEKVLAGKGTKKIYKITVRYTKDNYIEYSEVEKNKEIVKIGYSAIQVTN